MKWLKENADDIKTLLLCLFIILLIIIGIGGYGYCAINYGGKPITDMPSICVQFFIAR